MLNDQSNLLISDSVIKKVTNYINDSCRLSNVTNSVIVKKINEHDQCGF